MHTSLTPQHNNKATLVYRLTSCGLALLAILFIFANSSRTGPASGQISTGITSWVNGIPLPGGTTPNISETLIRKLGHVGEFALLGLLLILALRSFTSRLWQNLGWVLWIGLFVAVLDEFLQRYVPGRSSDVRDILIDFGGIAIGIIVGMAGMRVLRSIRNYRRRKTPTCQK